MKTKYLFPSYCKIAGKIIAAPSLVLLFVILFNESFEWNIDPWGWLGGFADELAIIGSIIGLTLAAFSKEKIEDEYIEQLRSDALMFAVIAQSILTIIFTVLLYDTWSSIMFIFGALVTTLVIFVVKFNVDLYRLKKSCKDE